MTSPQILEVIDSHTGGEPTRVIVAGGPQPPPGTMADRLAWLRRENDWLRAASVNEPRGSDVLVGALLCPPQDPACVAGVLFFNNVGYLGMCGHGTIGLMVTLAHLGRIRPGLHHLETPVGKVAAFLHENGSVTVRNVPSYRTASHVAVVVEGLGTIHGDVAWGGNWFFLVEDHREELSLARVDRLTEVSWNIRQALTRQGITGTDGGEIDHIELFGPSKVADSRNFVLCPGKAYDRSPCGTGTSAKLACLAAKNLLLPGHVWRQESIVGSIFEGTYERLGDQIIPSITGTAHVIAEGRLVLDPRDPFRLGIRA